MKNKKKILNRILFEIKKGIKRIYWLNFHFFKQRQLNKKIYNKRKFSIAIILPTKKRSKKFKRMLDSFLKYTLYPERLNFYILFDKDDNEHSDYEKIILQKDYSVFKFNTYQIDFDTNPKRVNFLARKTNEEILFSFNDDAVILSNNWDDILDDEFSKIDYKKPYCIWPECGMKYSYLHTDFPIINSQWFQKLGYLAKELFIHWYVDKWICELCFITKKFHLCRKINIHQFSAHSDNNELDETHLNNLANDRPRKDYDMWHKSTKILKKDANQLLNFSNFI